MRTFITGSQAYGPIHDKSDIDIVIYTDLTTKDRLIALSDNGAMPCKYGKLNIIFATTEAEYAAWLLGKKLCEGGKLFKGEDLTKEERMSYHNQARDLFGTQYDSDSGESEHD